MAIVGGAVAVAVAVAVVVVAVADADADYVWIAIFLIVSNVLFTLLRSITGFS